MGDVNITVNNKLREGAMLTTQLLKNCGGVFTNCGGKQWFTNIKLVGYINCKEVELKTVSIILLTISISRFKVGRIDGGNKKQ